MSRQEQFFRMIEKHLDSLRRLGIRRIGLFGSVARGEDGEASDYDILVEFNPARKTYRAFVSLCDLLDQELADNYDLVTRESLSPWLRSRILAESKIVEVCR